MLDQPFALAPADQKHLTAITRRGRSQARTFQRASALLQLQQRAGSLHGAGRGPAAGRDRN